MLAERVTFVVALPPGETPDGVSVAITTCETVILAVPLPPAYVPSPEYVAVNVLTPLLNPPAGMVIVAVPFASACCEL